MPKRTKKEIEREYFDKFCKTYMLPKGIIKYGDKPDVIHIGDRKTGIEITNFYHTNGSQIKSEQRQQKIRKDVINKAQKIYLEKMEQGRWFSFTFNKDCPIRNKEKLAKRIANLLIKVDKNFIGIIDKNKHSHIPELNSVNVYKDPNGPWRIIVVYDSPWMFWDKLIEIVKEKEKKVKNYESCDAYWLIIVIDFWDPAQDQTIGNYNDNKIESDIFEKILVYKTAERQVFDAMSGILCKWN